MHRTNARCAQFLLALCILCAVASCSATRPRRDPTGELFPAVRPRPLTGAGREILSDLGGAPAIVLVGYVMDAQFDIDRWLVGLLQVGTPVARLEMPTIDGLVPGLFAGTIDGGMRSGIPSEDWAAVATLYGADAAKIVEFTGNERPRNARVLLLDREGRVAWYHDRGFSPGKLLELDLEARALAVDAKTMKLLFDFSDPAVVAGWRSIDDVVMGGRSSSRFVRGPEASALFTGNVSLENNGGFASVRSSPAAIDLSGQQGLELDLVGDGQRYKLSLRLDEQFDGVSYQAEFDAPSGARTRVRVPLSSLRPEYRGRLVPNAPAFDPARVATVGLLISDKQAGPFRLELASIAAYP